MILVTVASFPGTINLVNLIIFIETFIMTHVFGSRLEKRKYFWARLIASFICGGTLVYCFPMVRFSNFWTSWLYSSFMYLYILLIAVLTAFVCYKGSLSNYIFVGSGGYAAHHVRSCIEDFSLSILGLSNKWNFYDRERYIPLFITSFIFFGIIIFFYVKNKKIQPLNSTKRVVFLSFLIVVIDIFLSCFAMFPWALDGKASTYVTNIYNFITSLFALGLMFGLINKQNIEKEIAILDYIIQEQEKQFKISRDAMESINIKAHDLRHHINYMMEDKGYFTNEEVKELNEKINTFNSIYETNNQVIDVVLSSRAITCDKHHIELTCIVDGKLFNFMERYELYALFENALDNAIDAVRKISNKERRFIFVSVKQTNNMISLHIENSFDGKDIEFVDGLPVTSNNDKLNHGLGIKSIKRIVDKYKGFMNINCTSNVFYLDICFPLMAVKEKASENKKVLTKKIN